MISSPQKDAAPVRGGPHFSACPGPDEAALRVRTEWPVLDVSYNGPTWRSLGTLGFAEPRVQWVLSVLIYGHTVPLQGIWGSGALLCLAGTTHLALWEISWD